MKLLVPAVAFSLFQMIQVTPAIAAQEQEASSEAINRVGLGTEYVLQEESLVDLPVYISLVPFVQVSRVSFDLVFSGKELSWVHAESGIQADLSVKSELRRDPANPAQIVVHLEISSEGTKGIANGVIASVRLRVHPEVSIGSKPVSVARLTGVRLNTPEEPVPNLAGFGSSVEVVSPEDYPYVGCFFFTH